MDCLPKIITKRSIPNHAAIFVWLIAAYISAVVTALVLEPKLYDIAAKFGFVTVLVILFMTVIFFVSRLIKRMDIIDTAWGPAFIVAASASFFIGGQTVGINLQTLLLLLVTVWGVRLSYSIMRRLISHEEDKRYVELRKKWKGSEALNSYLRIFLAQAVFASVTSTAVIFANLSNSHSITAVVFAGLVIWVIGFFFEAMGDFQLKRFLREPKNKGKLMTKGLWAFTRHPNYFGEATMWVGIALISSAVFYGWVGIITPLLITYLLYFVSGVPMTEASFSKKPGWKSYKERVSKFVPLAPKR